MIRHIYKRSAPTNVVGLPVTQCASLLLEHGVIAVRAAIGEQRGKP